MRGSSLPGRDSGFGAGSWGSSPVSSRFAGSAGSLARRLLPGWRAGLGRLRNNIVVPFRWQQLPRGRRGKSTNRTGEKIRGECLPTVCCVLLLFVVFLPLLWQPRGDMPGCSIAGTSEEPGLSSAR